MQYEQLKGLLAHQSALIGRVALENNLNACLFDIARHVEHLLGNEIKAAIFSVEQSTLNLGAAPSLPKHYTEILQEIPIANKHMPCAVSARTGKSIIIGNLSSSKYCKNFSKMTWDLGLQACWCVPITASSNHVVGVFVIYYHVARKPDDHHTEVMEYFVHLTRIALEKHHLLNQQQRAQEQIEQLAFYDPLTSLPNRRLLMNHTQKVIERAIRNSEYGALIFIDLNGFKRINDSLGHHVGDNLLISVAQRLKESLREVDTISRIGGDEFVILLEDLKDKRHTIEKDAKNIAKRTLRDLEDYFELSGRRYKIDASIGIAVISEHDKSAIEVLKHADAAMYEAKKSHTKRICFHNERLQTTIDNHLRIESEINDSLEHLAFHAHYQPQVDLNGKLIAAEALIRWHHPEKGLLYPKDFIQIAERMGAIHKMQETMLIEACKTITDLLQTGKLSQEFRIAINICPSQLKLKNLCQTLMTTINQYSLSPKYFMLEITEGMLIDDLDKSIATLRALRELGFKISIDDFGTGYSSLSYLNSLPVNEIKIDKSFIDSLNDAPDSHCVIDSVIALSKHFKFDVIAEGIEKKSQLEAMKLKEVKGMQGFLFAKPMNQADFIDWVKAA